MSTVPTRAIVGTILVTVIVGAGAIVSPSTAITAVESLAADPVLFGAVVAGLYLVRPLFAWPTTPLAIVVGYGYGVSLGVPIALVGVVVTVIPVFFAARWFVDPADCSTSATARNSDLVARAGDAIRRYYRTAGPIRGVTASRLAPIPSDVSTCAAAASGVRLRHLVVGTAIGELPWTVAAVIVGASAATITTGGLGELGLALTAACLLAAGVLLAGPLYRVLQARTEARTAGQPVDS